MLEEVAHCIEKMLSLTQKAEKDGALSPKDIFQFGYNAGRLAEITGEGRELWWDLLKGYVEQGQWILVEMELASAVHRLYEHEKPNVTVIPGGQQED